jgi:hypothetical protein
MKKQLILAGLVITAASVRADTPIQLSLTPDIALFPKDTLVRGLALNIWGQNPQTSLNLGLVNGSTGDSAGFSWGLANYADSYRGVQFGWVNLSYENYVGWQQGWVNIAQGTFTGFQSGLINVSESTTGFQLGVINYAQTLKGVQIGFVNLAMNNQVFFEELPDQLAPGFPILNWSF